MSFTTNISRIWTNLQQNLFPIMECHVGELTPLYKKLTAILELIRIEEFLRSTHWNLGRPCKSRANIARAFIVKIVLKLTYTKQLVELLKRDAQLKVICGFKERFENAKEKNSAFCNPIANYAQN